jgi:asparaginyl-tRNA synthetase
MLALFDSTDPDGYPVPKNKNLTLENLRTVTHMRMRTNLIAAMFRVRNALATATHQFFQQNGRWTIPL